jgi:hypothetical protein
MKNVYPKYPASFDGEGEGEGDDLKPKATDKELTELIRAQAARIKELETESVGFKDLQSEVSKLQEALATNQSMGELVTELKAMSVGGNADGGGDSKEPHPLQVAAESGDMKTFRKLRAAGEE